VNSAIGRAIDIRLASNRFVVAATFAAGAVGMTANLIRGDGNAVGAAFLAGGGAFLGWAIARELDPDHNLTAYLAAPLAVTLWFFDPSGLLSSGAVLLAVRVLVGTTGRSPGAIDAGVLVAYATATGLRPGGIVAASALGVALLADAWLSSKRSPLRYLIGLAAIAGAAVTSLAWANTFEYAAMTVAASIATVAAAGAGVLTPIEQPTSVGDFSGNPLERRRLSLGRLLAVAVVAGYVVLGGTNGVTQMGTLIAALVALGIVALHKRAAIRSR
jgi:hypothetical protein